MLKRLWQILGPVICAVLMVVMLLACVPSSTHSHSLKAEKKDAVSLTKTGFKSKYKKVRALSDSKHRFVPFSALVNGCVLIKCTRQCLLKPTIEITRRICLDKEVRLL